MSLIFSFILVKVSRTCFDQFFFLSNFFWSLLEYKVIKIENFNENVYILLYILLGVKAVLL